MRIPSHSIIGLVLFMGACGGGEPPAAADPAASHASGGDHGRHHHHHDGPESLRPLMRDLHGRMVELRAALGAGDVEASKTHAHAIAVACEDQDVHDLDPERFGPRFAEIDHELHTAAAEMAASAEAGDLDAAGERYASLLASCESCHAQAPTASYVDLSELAATTPD